MSSEQVRPRRGGAGVAVVGAGMVGLSTAWFLQERGIDVEVLERRTPGAGASWGNAGWLAPALTTPLPSPDVLGYGMRAVLDPASPVYVPISARPALWRFLTGFARHCTPARWTRAMTALRPLNERALDAFDELAAGGVDADTPVADPFLACFHGSDGQQAMLAELAELAELGQKAGFEALDGAEARRRNPALTEHVTAAVQLHDQRFIDPPAFVAALAHAVARRGGRLRLGCEVRSVYDQVDGVRVETTSGRRRYDAVVLAPGAWMPDLVGRLGVRVPVQAGRGYSFSVAADTPLPGPVYLPDQRVACTPLGGRLRIAGMMEFRGPDDPLDPRRVRAVVEAARPFFTGLRLDDRRDEWVGSRPCTPDGLPLVGRTLVPRVYAAGGHGMWGIVLGPRTGQLLAEAVATGRVPDDLRPLDPLR
ncbi:NAD(P)/FAD-dependent oxidoreductase [Pseudonocardia lacus]|uniref:NAD(P)/FAD-dependent oxidoreductase n=1 Tax=Pseudonocardia lacus TaxID=2835865 RepID=UPI001BDD1CA5|nr:FAD-dependent oxidoreductase [Pseudonocardia lacus]